MSSPSVKSFFSTKDLKAMKKDDIIRLFLDSQKSASLTSDNDCNSPECPYKRSSKVSSEGHIHHDALPDVLLGQIKATVVEAVHQLKSELRNEYEAKLRETDMRLSHEINSLRTEFLAYQNKFNNQFKEVEKEFLRDLQESELRKDNIIIFGLKESDATTAEACKNHDLEAIKTLSAELGVNELDVRQCFRLGRRSERPRPIKVTCRQRQQRFDLLRCAPRIRRLDTALGFERVFIKPDLSPKEQVVDRQLRQELKSRRDAGERVTIRGGQIITVDSKMRQHTD
jgi:HPt (histidine-containing phosphotransfer) domain-containing protein